jgi:hypothetical protein
MNTFWEERLCEEGKIWRDTPSRTAKYAITLFKKNILSVSSPSEIIDRVTYVRSGYEYARDENTCDPLLLFSYS